MTDEQTTDNITVDMNTGERSDEQQAQTFSIVEHTDGKRYIAADKVEEYRQHKAEELAAMQTEIDDTLAAIEEIDRINAVEERQQIMADFVAKFGDDYDMSEVINFDSEEEFEKVMDYLTATYQSSFGNPSAGFGAAKEAEPANSYKNQYERGAAAAREIFQKRGR